MPPCGLLRVCDAMQTGPRVPAARTVCDPTDRTAPPCRVALDVHPVRAGWLYACRWPLTGWAARLARPPAGPDAAGLAAGAAPGARARPGRSFAASAPVARY